jgi:hypothetical protein
VFTPTFSTHAQVNRQKSIHPPHDRTHVKDVNDQLAIADLEQK